MSNTPNLLGNGPSWGSIGSGTSSSGQQPITYNVPGTPGYIASATGAPQDDQWGHYNPNFTKSGRTFTPQWGGGYGLANQTANQLSALANQVGNRSAQDFSQMSAPGANPYETEAQAEAARQQQIQGLGMLAQSAAGGGPSAATLQMGQALGGQDTANAFAAMHSGGAGNAAASLQGLGNANMNAVGQGAAGRMAEIQRAQGEYAQGAEALTGSDLEQQKLATQLGNAQAQANLATEQGNWQAQVAYQNMANQTLEDQLSAEQQYNDVRMGNNAQLGVVNFNNQQAFNNNAIAGGFNAAGSLASLATQGMNQPDQTASPTEADLENPYAGGDYGSGSYGGGAVEG